MSIAIKNSLTVAVRRVEVNAPTTVVVNSRVTRPCAASMSSTRTTSCVIQTMIPSILGKHDHHLLSLAFLCHLYRTSLLS